MVKVACKFADGADTIIERAQAGRDIIDGQCRRPPSRRPVTREIYDLTGVAKKQHAAHRQRRPRLAG